MILIGTDRKTQMQRIKQKNFTEDQIKRRLKFQLSTEKCLLAIKKLQNTETYRLLAEIDGTKDINKNASILYKKLEEEYQKRVKIIR
jgi:dephospho-CoA kinase